MKFLYVVRFRENGGNPNGGAKTYKTTAKSSKDAASRMKKKGRILSVKKVKKLSS